MSAARRDAAGMHVAGTDTALSKVAKVTFGFWVMKICATTLGETGGDLLSMTLHLGYAASSLILLTMLGIVLGMQLAAKRFHPVLYWSVIVLTSTAGTTMSDFTDRTLGLGYAKGASLLLIALVAVLALWRTNDVSLSVDRIRSRKTESFYWAAILVSNTLGTALGDFLADDSGLGFLGGALLIGSLIACTAIAAYTTRLNRVVLFWLAFVLTRPFGATFGDLLTKPTEKGGLDFGTIGSSLILAALLAVFMVLASRQERRRIQRPL